MLENPKDCYQDKKGQSYRPSRPNFLKLTDLQLTSTKTRKKSKSKLKERSSSVRDRFLDDPAYTEDVRHLALPMRRNSGDSNLRHYNTEPKKKHKSTSIFKDENNSMLQYFSSIDTRGRRAKKYYAGIYNSDEFYRKNYEETSSSECIDQQLVRKRGQSLERRGYSLDYTVEQEAKYSSGDKNSWFPKDLIRAEKTKCEKKERSKASIDGSYTITTSTSAGMSSAVATQKNKSGTYKYVIDEDYLHQRKELLKSTRSLHEYYQQQEQNHLIQQQFQQQLQLHQQQNPSAFYRQRVNDLFTDPSKLPSDEFISYPYRDQRLAYNSKSNNAPESNSKLQIGKRFLKGEIGIKSFNYYLIKEGIKTSKKSVSKPKGSVSMKSLSNISKSEENLYEEIFVQNKFQNQLTSTSNDNMFASGSSSKRKGSGRTKAAVVEEPHSTFSDCALCIQQCKNIDCDICLSNNYNFYHSVDRKPKKSSNYSAEYQHHHHHHHNNPVAQPEPVEPAKMHDFDILEYQSYNPNNPNVYKIETTPVAFNSDYHAFIQQPPNEKTTPGLYEPSRTKSSSSSDSLHQRRSNREPFEPIQDCHEPQPTEVLRKNMFKTNSNASISETSMKSENSTKYQRTGNMSDSSLGDSLFSYPGNRRYFGSSESCRFGFDCRRCSNETEKCSFSDTCRTYECKNCDCSSSYFSSDFDDTNNAGLAAAAAASQNFHTTTSDQFGVDAKTTRYAKDFMKHVHNVKMNLPEYSQYQQQQVDVPRSSKNTEETMMETSKTAIIESDKKSSKATVNKSSSSSSQSNQSDETKTKSFKVKRRAKYETNEAKILENCEKLEMELNNQTPPNNAPSDEKKVSNSMRIQIPSVSTMPMSRSTHQDNTVEEGVKKNDISSGSKEQQQQQQQQYLRNEDTMTVQSNLILQNKAEKTMGPVSGEVVREIDKSNNGKQKSNKLSEGHLLAKIDVPTATVDFITASTSSMGRSVGGGGSTSSGVSSGNPKNDKLSVSRSDEQHKEAHNKFIKNDDGDTDGKLVDLLSGADKISDAKPQKREGKQRKPQQRWSDMDDEDDDVFLSATSTDAHSSANTSTADLIPLNRNEETTLKTPKTKTTTQQESNTNTDTPTASQRKIVGTEHQISATENQNKSQNQTKMNFHSTQVDNNENVETLSCKKRMIKSSEQHGETGGNSAQHLEEMKESNKKLLPANVAGIENISRDSAFAAETSVRDQLKPPTESIICHTTDDPINQSYAKAEENEPLSLDSCDIIDFPLPEIPQKSKKKIEQEKNIEESPTIPANVSEVISKTCDNNDIPSELAKTESPVKFPKENEVITESQPEQSEMHYRSAQEKPTYLFGEHLKNTSQNNGIYLNKSGWVQVSQRGEERAKSNTLSLDRDVRRGGSILAQFDNSRRSKIEQMINRNEARKLTTTKTFKQENVTILTIDPQSSSVDTSDRPGFLPVKKTLARGSPPPVTPILSPPLAFQDNKSRKRSNTTTIHLTVASNQNRNTKGMVFSRSFEYDTKKGETGEQNEKFSKSFDNDLAPVSGCTTADPRLLGRDKSPIFAGLTGNSPNYLTKRVQSRDTSPVFPKTIPSKGMDFGFIKAGNTSLYHSDQSRLKQQLSEEPGNSRQQSRQSRFSRFNANSSNTPKNSTAVVEPQKMPDSVANQRLNSCDSGARSDYSNDEDEDDDKSSSLAISYNSSASSSKKNVFSNLQPIAAPAAPMTSIAMKKQRSLTPERQNEEIPSTPRQSVRKRRSLTPDKRSKTTEDKKPLRLRSKNDVNSSQTSLMSRQSSGSRASTLERKKRYDNSSSSSLSSDERENSNVQVSKNQYRPNLKIGGEYRIRRSRSLQLSERSPSRLPLQKALARASNQVPQPKPATSRTPEMQRSNFSMRQFQDDGKYLTPFSVVGGRKVVRKVTGDKSQSFDVDYEKAKYEFDKSRSFDDEYFDEFTRNKFIAESRSFSHDRVFGLDNASNVKQANRLYGARLHDHNLVHNLANRNCSTRSPIMNFSRNENMPLDDRLHGIYATANYARPMELFHKPFGAGSGGQPQMENSSPGSDFDGNAPDFGADFDVGSDEVNVAKKEPDLVSEFLCGKKFKSETYLNQRSQRVLSRAPVLQTPTGSCTASSCDFWPHCGLTTINQTNFDQNSLKICDSVNDNHISGHHSQSKKDDNFTKSSKQSSDLVSVTVINSSAPRKSVFSVNAKCDDSEVAIAATTISKKPPISEKLNKSSLISLEDREMPITRESIASKVGTNQVRVDYSTGEDMDKKSTPTSIDFKNGANEGKTRFYLQNNSKSRKHDVNFQMKSQSLPKSFLRHCSLSEHEPAISTLVTSSSSMQMRAVSSPSLSENPIDSINSEMKTKQQQNNSNNISSHHDDTVRVSPNVNNHVSASVLQKFKKTFSHLKSQKAPTSVTEPQPVDNNKHRFGNLVWRTSKERRKTKSHRRDKCNSGDSGIQVELDNDEHINDEQNLAPLNLKIRRTNSAKAENNRSPMRKTNENLPPNIALLSGRSLSQPTDLDRLANREETDDDDDEEDDDAQSCSSQLDEEPVFAEVLYTFNPGGPQELALEKGSLVEVLRKETGPWWWGQVKHDAVIASSDQYEISEGWFPKDFVRVIPAYQKATDFHPHLAPNNTCDSMPHEQISLMASEIAAHQWDSEARRESIVKELLEAEINYVKLLNSICAGYIKVLRDEKTACFSLESINIIFSNIEKISRFQQTFLDALRLAALNNRIGEVFLEYQSAFMIYSTYCNSYSRALMELESYTGNKEAATILEKCRMLENLPELPLSAHLLVPIQRICRYPLHLSELVKHTPHRKEILSQIDLKNMSKSEQETVDCKEMFELALSAMKRVTEMVNEGKRHSEYLSRIQARFENFQGPPLNVHSTRLFLQTDAIRMTPNLWNNTYTLFLFDRQLIYCKKDLLKRTQYIFKGRIFLDNCRILNLPDGKMFGVSLKNALRIYCDTKTKWFDFCFRSSSSKLRFLNTLSAERQFCGENLFVSELAGPVGDDDDLTDSEIHCTTEAELNERAIDNLHILNGNTTTNFNELRKMSAPSSTTSKKFSETLPHKLKKHSTASYDFNSTNSLGRRKIGKWFRKTKSTNSTPSQSPTYQPVAASTPPGISDSSSQSSPGLSSNRRPATATKANPTQKTKNSLAPLT